MKSDKTAKLDAKRIIIARASISVFALVIAALSFLIFKYAGDRKTVEDLVDSLGPLGPFAHAGLVALRMILVFTPAEPLELAAGYAWGAAGGRAVCCAGYAAGSLLIFLAIRFFGPKLAYIFFGREEIESVPFLKSREKLYFLMIVLFLIPGTPKDLMSWRAPLGGIKFSKWILISTVARLPSIITSTVSGSLAGRDHFGRAAVLFLITRAVGHIGIMYYRKKSKERRKESQ